MKMPTFSKMTVEALMSARSAIDQLLNKRLPSARRELEKRLSDLNNFVGGDGKARKSKTKTDGRSKLKGRKVAPKYRSPDGETWSGRGMKPRWLTAAIKKGAGIEDFVIGAGGRLKKTKKASGKRGKKQIAAKKRPTPKRKRAKPASKNLPEAASEPVAA